MGNKLNCCRTFHKTRWKSLSHSWLSVERCSRRLVSSASYSPFKIFICFSLYIKRFSSNSRRYRQTFTLPYSCLFLRNCSQCIFPPISVWFPPAEYVRDKIFVRALFCKTAVTLMAWAVQCQIVSYIPGGKAYGRYEFLRACFKKWNTPYDPGLRVYLVSSINSIQIQIQ